MKIRFFFVIAFLMMCTNVHAATYYVSPSGSDTSGTGSLSNPWRTPAYADGRLANNDVLILRGGTYSGTGALTRITANNVSIQNYPNETPILDGEWTQPQGTGYPDDFATCLYLALLRVTGSNCTIDGITFTRSRGIGIDIQDTIETTARNCHVSYSYGANVRIGRDGMGDQYNVLENSLCEFGNYARDADVFRTWTNIGQNVQIKGRHNIVRNNIVRYGPCAGVESLRDNYTLVENNLIYGHGLTQFHCGWTDHVIVRNNVIFGATRPNIYSHPMPEGTAGYGTGVELMCELWYPGDGFDSGHEVYGNMIANTQYGIRIGWQTGKNRNYPNNAISACTVYNNTIIEPYTSKTQVWFERALSIMGTNDTYGYNHLGSGHVIRNNFFYQSNEKAITYDTFATTKVTMGYNLWNKIPAACYQSSTDPTYPGYGSLNLGSYFTKTTGWTGPSVTEGSIVESDFMLLGTASLAIDHGYDTGLEYNGAAPDIGAKEYGIGGEISTDDPVVYELESDGTDEKGNYNLTAVGSVYHGNSGVIIDESTDGYYRGETFNDTQISVIVEVNLNGITGVNSQPFVGRWDWNGGMNWEIASKWDNGVAQVRLGKSGGTAFEAHSHDFVLTPGTDYWIGATIDGENNLIDLWVVNDAGVTQGTDINNYPVLSAAEWNYNESDLLIGVDEDNNEKDADFFAHGTIKYARVIHGIMSKSDFLTIVSGSEPSSGTPEITASGFCECETFTYLTENQQVTAPGTYSCWCADLNEPGYGSAAFPTEAYVNMTNDIDFAYYTGINTTKLVFRRAAQLGDQFGSINIESSNPIMLGASYLRSSANIDFTISPLSNSTYFPVFAVEGQPIINYSISAPQLLKVTTGPEMQ